MNLQSKLIKLYSEIDELKNKRNSSDSDFKAWKTDVQLCLSGLYGEKSIQLKNFNDRPFSPMVFVGNTDCHGPYVRDLETTKKEFERYLKEHPEIRRRERRWQENQDCEEIQNTEYSEEANQ